MRLLHTSDWHLGRTLHRADLRDAQAAFLDSLVEVVRSERVDAVLVAGDVYDRAVPPLDAVALAEQGLERLRDAGARVVVISGNHDSASRLGFGSRLVDASGVHLRTRVASCAEPVLLEDADGPVAVYAVPYLEPEAVRDDLPGDTADRRPRARRRPRPRPAVLRRRPRRARGPLGRARPRLGRGRGGLRERARHHGRRGRQRAGRPVRPVRLRRARPPARAAAGRR